MRRFGRGPGPLFTQAGEGGPTRYWRETILALSIFLAILLAILLATRLAHAAPASTVDPSIGKIEVTLDLPKDKPYVGEMIMLRMRSFIRADIVLDEVRQPPLVDFDVQQLGRDKPIDAMVDGFRVQGIERDLAIFPQQSGRLIIDPFVRHVTIVNGAGQRVEADFASKPVYVDVQNYAAINPAGAWWLPAKSLSITDRWSPEPDEIPRGSLSRRTITVEAVGITADRLPPPPVMRAPGIIAFRGPVERQTAITEDGPVARAVYRWDLRPATGPPAKLPAIEIPWFDTSERRMRDAAVPERWVAYLGTFVHTRHETMPTFRESLLEPGPLAAGLVGFAWTAALIGFMATARARRGGRRSRHLSRLRRAARFHDEKGFLTILAELARRDPSRWERVAGVPDVAVRLAALDRALYGKTGGDMPALRPLAVDIQRAWRGADPAGEMGACDALPPIDGDDKPRVLWSDRLWARRAIQR